MYQIYKFARFLIYNFSVKAEDKFSLSQLSSQTN